MYMYMYLFCAVPTGSPSIESFVITSNTTAQLTWLPPPSLEQNGVIVDYTIELCSSGGRGYRNTSNNDTTYEFEGKLYTALSRIIHYLVQVLCIQSLTILLYVPIPLGLTPFTTYIVSVAALTSQGRGPYSDSVTNTTFEGRKYMNSMYSGNPLRLMHSDLGAST